MTKNGSGFLLALLISVLNIVMAILFSKNGYEAFVTASVAIGILFTILYLDTIRLTFQSKVWLIVKLLCIPLFAFVWFLVVIGVMLTISRNAYMPNINVPAVNWWLILIGTLPYLLPRLNFLRSKSPRYTLLSIITTIYSVVVFLIAAIDFNSSRSLSHNIILVLAIQLQYLMNYAVLKTNYLEKSLASANNLVARLKLAGNGFGMFIVITIVGLPFFIPLAVVLTQISSRN
jgi:hypothetical protein